jgi:hypothetical protein
MSSGLGTTITNTGNAPLQISAVALSGANAVDFQLGAGNTCVVGSVPAGGSCQLEVAFRPQSEGTKTAVVTLTHNGSGGSTAITVTGAAAAATATSNASPTSSALAPSNVGGVGSVSPEQLLALALTLLLVPTIRRRCTTR